MPRPNMSEDDLKAMKDRMKAVKEHGGVVGTAKGSKPVRRRDECNRVLISAAGSNPAHAPQPCQHFFVPGPLPGANDIIRKHWRVYDKLKKVWGLTIHRAILVAKLTPMTSCTIRYHWVEPTPRQGRIRDRDNIRFGAKFINDALVVAGILPDDGPDGVVSLTDTFEYHASKPGVYITLKEWP